MQKLDYSSSIGSPASHDSPLPNDVDNFNKNVKSESNIQVTESSDGAHTKVVDKDLPSDSNSQVPPSSDGSVVVSETKDIKDLAALQVNLPGPSVIENVASVESAGPSVPAGSTGSSIDDNVKITYKNLSYESNPQLSSSSVGPSIVSEAKETKDIAEPALGPSNSSMQEDGAKVVPGSSNVTEIDETGKPVSVGLFNNSNLLQIEPNDTALDPSDSKSGRMPASSPLPSNASTGGSVDSGSFCVRSLCFPVG